MKKSKIIIGLTGPIASGKNEAAKILNSWGGYIIDADKIGHLILNSHKDEIVSMFGKNIISDDGSIGRAKLATIVFSDKKKLNKLNSFAHPKILNYIEMVKFLFA